MAADSALLIGSGVSSWEIGLQAGWEVEDAVGFVRAVEEVPVSFGELCFNVFGQQPSFPHGMFPSNKSGIWGTCGDRDTSWAIWVLHLTPLAISRGIQMLRSAARSRCRERPRFLHV